MDKNIIGALWEIRKENGIRWTGIINKGNGELIKFGIIPNQKNDVNCPSHIIVPINNTRPE